MTAPGDSCRLCGILHENGYPFPMTAHRSQSRSAPSSSIEVLTFDVFGTVVDWHRTIVEEGASWNEQHGWAIDWSAFACRWRVEGYFRGIADIVAGKRAFTTADRLHREKLVELLREQGVSPDDETIDRISRVWQRLKPYPDVLAGLNRLRQTRALVAFSNGNLSLLLRMARNAGLPWDGIFSADLIKAWKPQPLAYQTVAALLDVEPPRILMVAAHTRDLEAARAAGFRTAFVARPGEWGARPVREPRPEEPFDFDVTSLEELAAALET